MPRPPRSAPPPALPPAPFLANLPWVDFVNTRYIHRDRWVDAIPSPRALADWLVAADLAPAGGPRELAALRGRPGGRRVLREAHALRSSLAALARTLVNGAAPSPAAIAAINRVLRAAPAHQTLRRISGGLDWQTVPVGRDPLALLSPVAASAAAFLVDGDVSRLRACGNPKCVLYFHDRTRNARRRFCSPATCGNRVKAARRYERLRERRSG
ncbi:MAG: CGNR zinc finger domain-containing protein [Gemmatimonadales bacterium]